MAVTAACPCQWRQQVGAAHATWHVSGSASTGQSQGSRREAGGGGGGGGGGVGEGGTVGGGDVRVWQGNSRAVCCGARRRWRTMTCQASSRSYHSAGSSEEPVRFVTAASAIGTRRIWRERIDSSAGRSSSVAMAAPHSVQVSSFRSWRREMRERERIAPRMSPDEEQMTKRSPLDFPAEWERPGPSRRPDIFPQFTPMKTPLPQPMPGDPPEKEDEDEEDDDEDPEPEEEPEPEE
ncbi:hypothetical protein CBR_g48216 [Chara braunii]|uniref:Uncharacterized protein n=1 Tax=Chara braunii TaxID=69332 RepID=A0A388M2E5_CHABU|nr:hypothetical protein CBR_g48216 [Chara braunii]|eukprot:GBG88685.1 hypothetical protein CBR_g48216 [Chara braunii]